MVSVVLHLMLLRLPDLLFLLPQVGPIWGFFSSKNPEITFENCPSELPWEEIGTFGRTFEENIVGKSGCQKSGKHF